MKWFKHDSTCHIDAKVKKLKQKFGISGYGLYQYILELVAIKVDRENISFALEDDAETIAYEWRLDVQLVQEFLDYCVELGLFQQREDGVITCLKLASRLDDTNSKNPEIKNILAKLNGEKPPKEEAETPKETPKEPKKDRGKSEPVGETPSNSAQNRLDKNRKDKKEQNNAALAGYFFEGEVFNINHADAEKQKALYPYLDLLHNYAQLDVELRDTPKKQIWGTLNAKLRYRNEQASRGFAPKQTRASNVEDANQQNADYAEKIRAELEAEAYSGAPMETPNA